MQRAFFASVLGDASSAGGLSTIGQADSIQQVTTQGIALIEHGMVEVITWIVCHAQSLHDPARADILRHREGDDLAHCQMVATIVEDGARRFSGISVIPVLTRQSPADLDAGREVRLKARNCKANHPRKCSHPRNLHCPKPKAVLRKMSLDAINGRIAICSCHARKKLTDARIGIQGRERIAVFDSPASQKQSMCAQC
jgi:hypothetical protein